MGIPTIWLLSFAGVGTTIGRPLNSYFKSVFDT